MHYQPIHIHDNLSLLGKSRKSARIFPPPKYENSISIQVYTVKSEISWKLNRERNVTILEAGSYPIFSSSERRIRSSWTMLEPCNIPGLSTLPVSSRPCPDTAPYILASAQANRPIDFSLPLIFHLANTGLRRATASPRFLFPLHGSELNVEIEQRVFLSLRREVGVSRGIEIFSTRQSNNLINS